ncbi:MAG: RNA polymerase sigma factor [Pseudomonadota bacterium]
MLAMDTNWQLFARASDDRAALAELFERHRHFVYRLGWGVLQSGEAAEDIVQDVFLKIGSGRLKAVPNARFTTWLYGLAINTAREHARKRRRFWGAEDANEVLEKQADEATDPERADALRDLAKALAMLPIRQREVVLLRFYEGFDTQETADILGCREGTVKAHLHRATQTLREGLAPYKTERT